MHVREKCRGFTHIILLEFLSRKAYLSLKLILSVTFGRILMLPNGYFKTNKSNSDPIKKVALLRSLKQRLFFMVKTVGKSVKKQCYGVFINR